MTSALLPELAISDLYSRAWYSASIAEFLSATPDAVLGELTRRSDFSVDLTQRDAWLAQVRILRARLARFNGQILLEFSIPRMGRRIDAVILTGSIVVIVEFKVGAAGFDRLAIDQVWDYALDLKNFHAASHSLPIVPILVATDAKLKTQPRLHRGVDDVYIPVLATADLLADVIDSALQSNLAIPIDIAVWARAPYRPTPTIVEAARSLYANHSVEAIARFDAGATNLALTSRRVEELIDEARIAGQKIICFVTGVPGAGKTLVGLNVATRRSDENDPTHAVFLSGNDPLVAVLREALTRDEVRRRRARGEKAYKGTVSTGVKAFIQNVRHFRDEALADEGPPDEHVAIFDEAQRAWNLWKTADFMRRRRGRSEFDKSEPEFLISYMNRHRDWAAIVCLVGGGQEIHTGEAGIAEWLEAANRAFRDWRIYISSKLTDTEFGAGKTLESLQRQASVCFEDNLHLASSMRSFRAENVSAFVKALLNCEVDGARDALEAFIDRYPIAVTRNLDSAKKWVRDHARGSERFGLVASSKAQRLKPHAVDIRVKIDPVQWFLNEKEDTRSSYYLEDAATEFQVQGLELDWTCVTWDGDLRFADKGWSYHDFRGSRWNKIHDHDNRGYLLNAYRVLLTRARQGMVIFVPSGDTMDRTRSPELYDSTFEYLAGLGIPIVN